MTQAMPADALAPPLWKANPERPKNPAALAPNISPKPTSQKPRPATQKSITFLTATLMEFLARTMPDSRQVKPACIRITRIVQIRTQIVSIDCAALPTIRPRNTHGKLTWASD